MDDFIDIKSFILSDMNLISLFDFEIKLEKFSIESFPLFDELSDIIISSLFGIGIPFCFASYKHSNIILISLLHHIKLVICLQTFFILLN